MSQFFQTNFVFIFLQQKGTEKSHKKNSSRSKYRNQEAMENVMHKRKIGYSK